MVCFPNAKINLGLKILRRREDGYHDLETAFYPLPLTEVLLHDDFPTLPPVDIHLYKNIPIGAGLGGGSSDGASTLVALNRQFQLGLTEAQLLDYASRLGSDCPFFILNKPCLGKGRGHLLQSLPLDLSGYSFALIDPRVHISTAQAFSLCTPGEIKIPLQEILSRPVSDWREDLVNDFEEPIFRLYPDFRQIKAMLYETGAIYASLTGSGSSFFGIFEIDRAPEANPFPNRYNYRILR